MTNKEFVCWINGFLTLADDEFINAEQVTIIRNHTNLVAAIDGKLDEPISEFVLAFEKAIRCSRQISLFEARELSKSRLGFA